MILHLVGLELRRQWRSLVLLGALVTVLTGTVLASLVGADRSGSSLDRYLDAYRGPDLLATGDPEAMATLGDLDAVEAAIPIEGPAAFPIVDSESYFPLLLDDGGVLSYERMRAPVVEGRRPHRQAPLEVALSERTAERLGVGVGDPVPLETFSPEGTAAFFSEDEEEVEADGPAVVLEVVGIVRDPGDIGARQTDITLTVLSPAFREAYGREEIGTIVEGTVVWLAEAHEVAEVGAALAGAAVELDTDFSTDFYRQPLEPTTRAIATALRIFAAVVAAAGLVAVGQAVARLQQAASEDDWTLGAFGVTRPLRWARLTAPCAVAIGSGTVLGIGVAVAASPLFPIGLARRAEPDPGLHVDLAGLLPLAALVLVGLMLVPAGAALRRMRRATSTASADRVGRWGRVAANGGLPTPIVAGLSLAAGTPGRPGRVAISGTLLSTLGVLAALVFSTSVDRLRAEPRLYGWGWDAEIQGAGLSDLGDTPEALVALLRDDPDLEAASTLYRNAAVRLDGQPVFASAIADPHPELQPVVVRGTAPRGADEIALGADTLQAIDAAVGDTARLSTGDEEQTVRITGVVAFPVPEDGGSSGSGAYLSPTSAERLDLAGLCEAEEVSCVRTVAIAVRAGRDADAIAGRIEAADDALEVSLPIPPAEVDRLTAVEDLPRWLSVFLALLAAAAVSFATATTVRQRRRDLAVLRVLGMTGRHVRTVIAVLVLALSASGAVVGAALGLVVGRQIWRAVMTSMSLPFSPSLPVAGAVLVPVAALLIAQLVATASRRAASRVPASLVLRAE